MSFKKQIGSKLGAHTYFGPMRGFRLRLGTSEAILGPNGDHRIYSLWRGVFVTCGDVQFDILVTNYVYLCVDMHTYTYTYMYTISVYVYACMYVCTYVCMYVCMHVCT